MVHINFRIYYYKLIRMLVYKHSGFNSSCASLTAIPNHVFFIAWEIYQREYFLMYC